MPTTNDQQPKRGIFALFKGAPNSGKSVGALSFPNPFVLDFDRKMPTIGEKHFPGKLFSWEHFDDVFQLSDFLRPWMQATPDSALACPYETLIVDTLTSLSTTVLRSVDKTKGTNAVELMGKLSKDKDGTKTVEVMGMDYYNAEANFFERYFIDNLKILWARPGNPRHIIVIAHEITVESAPDLRTKLVTRTKSILTAGRKPAAQIPKSFDEEYVFRLERPSLGDSLNKSKRFCITTPDLDEDARTAYNFPDKIDFTNKSLYDELNKVGLWST
jgi:hypothetical protein